MSQEDHDKDLIRVTHYINPHNFWFKSESAYLYNAEEQKFQLELIEFCETNFGRGNITSGVYKPNQVGELVAVFYFQLGRWTRAVVDDIQEELGGQVICNLWAIDEGVPIKTGVRYIKPLPAKFAKMPSSVKHGGLEGILPAETSYDYLEGRSVHKIVENWASGVAIAFQNLIDDAVAMKFSILHHYKRGGVDIHFGSMQIISHKNVSNDAIALLEKVAGKIVMVVDKDEFYNKFPLLRTLDMRRSEDNEYRENMKYHTNTFRTEYSTTTEAFESERMRFQDKFLIEQARKKVLEWDMRNTASSSVVFTSPEVSEFTNPPLPESSELQGKPRRRYELAYRELIDEDSEEEHDTAMHRNKWKQNSKNNNPNPRKPQDSIYDKSMADVAPALHKIKLRRRAGTHQNPEEANTSKAPANGNSSALNIIPAGFSLANVQFSNGSVILGTAEPNVNRRMNSFGPKTGPVGNRRKPQQQQQYDDQDSSFDEKIIRRLDLGGRGGEGTTNGSNDDADEQW
ncbi:uncharacterized protein LOC135699675 [Ochlerotatus camptorhynchus]|uniref:uncharacterized protein LOC135699675 n=1 Tax=Ochlerotatus camptorhynchus TaxID=644619 RepID=UPI0031DDF9A3